MEQVGTNLFYQDVTCNRYLRGYYWEDETGDLNGPLDTLEQAKIEMAAYVGWLTHGDT